MVDLIRQLMHQRNISISKMSERINTEESALKSFFNKVPGYLDMLINITTALEISDDQFIDNLLEDYSKANKSANQLISDVARRDRINYYKTLEYFENNPTKYVSVQKKCELSRIVAEHYFGNHSIKNTISKLKKLLSIELDDYIVNISEVDYLILTYLSIFDDVNKTKYFRLLKGVDDSNLKIASKELFRININYMTIQARELGISMKYKKSAEICDEALGKLYASYSYYCGERLLFIKALNHANIGEKDKIIKPLAESILITTLSKSDNNLIVLNEKIMKNFNLSCVDIMHKYTEELARTLKIK